MSDMQEGASVGVPESENGEMTRRSALGLCWPLRLGCHDRWCPGGSRQLRC
jgi:hypothetical protein